MREMARHVGEENAVGMDVLYEIVFGRPAEHKINSTRMLRKLITAERKKGTPIMSTSTVSGGGYYLPRTGQEMEDYLGRIHSRALRALVMEARLRKTTLPTLLGQMQARLTGDAGDSHAE